MQKSKTDLLVVMAMPEEAQSVFSDAGVDVVFTGLGKVNAAYHLLRAINKARPKAVLNFGTAGSSKFPTHSVIECTKFVQRDMDLSALGFAPGVTPFESIPAELSFAKHLGKLESGTCGTGDSFETAKSKVHCDVVDMEAYALAKVCHLEGLPFVSVKYISDGSDHNASNDWTENLPKAAAKFIEVYREIEKIFTEQKSSGK